MHIKFVTAFIVSLVCITTCCAQSHRDFILGNANYAVPNPAALQILQSDPEQLLRPSTVRSLALSIGEDFNASSTGNNSVAAFGGEFAPLLCGETLSDYLSGRWHRVLVRMRISGAFSVDQNNQTHGAIGIRMMFHDDADLRADSSFARRLASSDQSPTAIDSIRTSMKQQLWNRTVAEGAAAIAVGHELNNSGPLAAERYALWFSGAVPTCGNTGQLAFGISGLLERDALFSMTTKIGALSARYYHGSYSSKLFAEGRWTATSASSPNIFSGIGGEINITNGFWIDGVAGATLMRAASPEWQFQLTLKYATQEGRE